MNEPTWQTLLARYGWRETARADWRPALGKPTLTELQIQLGDEVYPHALRSYLELATGNYCAYAGLPEPLRERLALLEAARLDFLVFRHTSRPEILLVVVNRNRPRHARLYLVKEPIQPEMVARYEQIATRLRKRTRRAVWRNLIEEHLALKSVSPNEEVNSNDGN